MLANRLAIVGIAFLALAMTGVVLLITDLLYSAAATVIATTVTALVFGILWYGIPLRRRLKAKPGNADRLLKGDA